MVKEPEKKVESKLRNEVKKLGGLCLKLLALHFIGIPDRLCLLPKGRIFFIELKATGEKPNKIQLVVHKKLRKLGFEVLVIDSTDKIKKFIDYVK